MRTLALLAAAIVTLAVEAPPRPAVANSAIGAFLCNLFGCGSFGVGYPECKMTAVRVDGTPSRHRFSFDQICQGIHGAHVEAAYDLGAGRAEESIKALSGQWSYRSQWNCASDPWIASGSVACGNPKMSSNGNPGTFDPAQMTYPTSAGSLSAKSRHVLAAQLENALNSIPATPPPPAPVDPPPAASGPDLTIIRIDGPDTLQSGVTGSYTFIIGNVGDSSASLEVNILFAGALQQIGQPSADSGLSCVVALASGKVNANMGCSGGQLEPKRSATITVQAIGRDAGTGSITASINNSRSLAEADYSNNVGRRDVTVN